MVLLEFYCDYCQCKFEQITSGADPDRGKCPKCHGKNTHKLISRFAVGGQGDLRETTLHGCHDCYAPTPGDCHAGHSHDEGGGHDDH